MWRTYVADEEGNKPEEDLGPRLKRFIAPPEARVVNPTPKQAASIARAREKRRRPADREEAKDLNRAEWSHDSS